MPVMDGFEATRRIRSQEASARHIPIVAMTASVMDEDRERCLAAGMDDYVTKPVNIKTLNAMLEFWVFGERSAGPHRCSDTGYPAGPVVRSGPWVSSGQ